MTSLLSCGPSVLAVKAANKAANLGVALTDDPSDLYEFQYVINKQEHAAALDRLRISWSEK